MAISKEDFKNCIQLPSWRNIYIFGPLHGEYSIDYIGPLNRPNTYEPHQTIEELINEPEDGVVVPEHLRLNNKIR